MPKGREPTGPKNTSHSVVEFLNQVAVTNESAQGQTKGRLVFAMDATASRGATWDHAIDIQSEMFSEASALGGLDVQLVYYKGFGEFDACSWNSNAATMIKLMSSVSFASGRTQIQRVLLHTIDETKKKRVNALVFVGDSMEENIDWLADSAGRLGLLGVPVFLFQEGSIDSVAASFRRIAHLSGGAYCQFDTSSPRKLREFLKAVAIYAAGGRRAMIEYGVRKGGDIFLLTNQMDKGQ